MKKTIAILLAISLISIYYVQAQPRNAGVVSIEDTLTTTYPWQVTFEGSAAGTVTVVDDGNNTTTVYIGAPASSGGGTGTVTTVKSSGTQVGDADIVTLDFVSGFTITESPDKEINIAAIAGGESTTVSDTATVDLTLTGADITADAKEAGLEGILDLQDLQGAVTDGQVPNNITITETDPNALLTAGTDIIKDTHIDWGTGANQVNPADFVDQDIGDITITTGDWAVENESHTHTTTTISGLDVSDDINLAGDTEIVLTGDALSIAAAITRDTEWNGLDFLVGTATGTLSAEIVAGTTPQGELGNTWASPTLDDSVTVTGWVLGTSSATQITSPTVIVDLLDADGAVDMDYGSVDVTDHTFITDGTGTGEIVLPAQTIDGTEVVNGTITGEDITASLDLGSHTSFEIPNGNPTIDTTGEIGIDTTDDQLQYMGASTKRVIPYTYEKCFTLETPTETDVDIPIWTPVDNITITSQYCNVEGGTSCAGRISDGTNNMEYITCDADGQADDGSPANATFVANEIMEFDGSGVTGSVTWINWCNRYTVDAQ